MKTKLYTPRRKSHDLTDDEVQMKPQFQNMSTAHNKTTENKSRRKHSQLHLNVTILQWLGLWPCNEDSKYFKAILLRTAFCFIFTVQTSIAIVEIMGLVVNRGCLNNPTENIYITACSVSAIAKQVTIIFKMTNIQHLLNILDNELAVQRQEGSPQYKKIVRVSTKQARMFTLVFVSLCTFGAISYSFVPFIDGYLGRSNNNKSSYKPMPYAAWLPFDVTETPLYELSYFYLALGITIIAAYMSCCDVLLVSLIIHLAGQFQILQASLTDIRRKAIKNIQAKDKQWIRSNNINISKRNIFLSATLETEESVCTDITKAEILRDSFDISLIKQAIDTEQQYLLKQCIKHHQILTELVQELDYICSPYMVIQILGSLVVICFVGFNMTTVPIPSAKFASESVIMTVAIIELFLFCWYSEELSIQNCNVYQAAYDSEWQTAPQSFKKAIQLIMRRAQAATTLTAARICTINLRTFTAILRVSYSNYALLRRLYDEDHIESTQSA